MSATRGPPFAGPPQVHLAARGPPRASRRVGPAWPSLSESERVWPDQSIGRASAGSQRQSQRKGPPRTARGRFFAPKAVTFGRRLNATAKSTCRLTERERERDSLSSARLLFCSSPLSWPHSLERQRKPLFSFRAKPSIICSPLFALKLQSRPAFHRQARRPTQQARARCLAGHWAADLAQFGRRPAGPMQNSALCVWRRLDARPTNVNKTKMDWPQIAPTSRPTFSTKLGRKKCTEQRPNWRDRETVSGRQCLEDSV